VTFDVTTVTTDVEEDDHASRVARARMLAIAWRRIRDA
jgi:hypothetical protein